VGWLWEHDGGGDDVACSGRDDGDELAGLDRFVLDWVVFH
jgi:hypothetical protein